jgi:serine protease Do
MFIRNAVWASLAIVSTLAFSGAVPAADPLTETIDKANKKLVKIFGAGGFTRLNNFGTGIIISKDGYILTVSSQLLDTADLVVHTYDGQRLRAQVVVTEPELDAALLKIKSEDPLDLDFFDFEAAAKRPPAEAGDWVLALSNTFEIALRDEPVTAQRGVIAAYTKMAGRRGVFEFPYSGDVYVVDATTNNPGAAGGALLTRKGDLLGIIGREIKNTQTDTWMNYAIPVGAKTEIRFKEVVKDKDGREVEQEKVELVTMPEFVTLGKQGKYKVKTKPTKPDRSAGGFHGIVFVPDILERTPAYIEDLVPGSPADKAGLMPDDLVSFVDGEPMISIKAFDEYIRKNTRDGTVIRLEVRRGETLQTVELKLGAHPPKRKAPETPKP